jgi:hypothetical protein
MLTSQMRVALLTTAGIVESREEWSSEVNVVAKRRRGEGAEGVAVDD